MAAFLSDEWFAQVRAGAAALPAVPGASLAMQHVVSGAPDGKVQCAVVIEDGRLTELRRGKEPAATCTVTWTYGDALAVVHGELTVDVAFMRGSLKVDGDYVGLLLGLRPVFINAEGRAFLAALGTATDAAALTA